MSPLGKHTCSKHTVLYISTVRSARTEEESQARGGYSDKCVSFKVLLIRTANYTHLLTCFCVCFSPYEMSVAEGFFDDVTLKLLIAGERCFLVLTVFP